MDTTSPQPSLWQRSTTRRFLRSRVLRGIVFVIFCLITLALLVLAEENWRGRRAWEKYRQEWEAKGERFDLASFIPKPVPAEQNFAMTPFLAPLLDYEFVNGTMRYHDSNAVVRAHSVTIQGGKQATTTSPSLGNWLNGQFCDLKAWQSFYQNNTNFPANPQPSDPARDVLFALRKYDQVLAELRAASRCPYAFFRVHYTDSSVVLLPHLSVLKSLALLPALRASADLGAKESEAALDDVNLVLHFAKSLQSEPFLVSQLVRLSIVQIATQPVWEGLANHRWTDAQLQVLQETLASSQLLEDYGVAMRGERAFGNEMMAQYLAGRDVLHMGGGWLPKRGLLPPPAGLFYQNQLVIDRLYQDFTLPAVDAAQHRVYPEKCITNIVAFALRKRTPYNMFAWMLFPAYEKAAEHFARTQTSVDLATVACGLERYHLVNGMYPEKLEALVPRFITKLPTDVISGQPLKYRLDAAGQPVIYSVGWNQTDDGGTVALTKGTTPNVDPNKGDWVWQYPAK